MVISTNVLADPADVLGLFLSAHPAATMAASATTPIIRRIMFSLLIV
ncbi:MAG: hypothetical protein U0Q22_06030 [Acidimicrobiales bacterium]